MNVALISVIPRAELEGLCVLAPERYDPRRRSFPAASGQGRGKPLRSLVRHERRTVNPTDRDERPCVVFDTSDAQEGIVVPRKQPIRVRDIGSAKKVIEANDLIVSRLRPYLRQVAFVDPAVAERASEALLLCSTEFFVLRPLDPQSLAFLVPFLLSRPVQTVLAAAQEGGHHPRFNEATLLGLPVPEELIRRRDNFAARVEQSIRWYRQAQGELEGLIAAVESNFE
jgi:hypothetical protein